MLRRPITRAASPSVASGVMVTTLRVHDLSHRLGGHRGAAPPPRRGRRAGSPRAAVASGFLPDEVPLGEDPHQSPRVLYHGEPLTRWRTMRRAASRKPVSGATRMGSVVMTSRPSSRRASSLLTGRRRAAPQAPPSLRPLLRWVLVLAPGLEPGGVRRRLAAAAHVQLGQYVRHVVLHRLLGEEHPLGDLPVGPAPRRSARGCAAPAWRGGRARVVGSSPGCGERRGPSSPGRGGTRPGPPGAHCPPGRCP